jgi:ABC-type transporter Mla subunit MlaD
VQGFVEQNRSTLSHNIKGLNQVSKVLVKQRAALDEVLTVAPTTLANLFHTYNPATGTLDTRTNLGETISGLTADPIKILCGIVAQSQVDKAGAGKVCDALKTLPIPKARTAALGSTTAPTSTREVEHVDRSLGGILEVRR